MTSEVKEPIKDGTDVEENVDGDAELCIDENDPDMKCGMGSFQPGFLQVFARISAFVSVYSVSGLLTSTLAVYVNSQVPMLEKEFGFSSKETGFLMSCNDLGYLTCIIFAGYIAKKVHIPVGLGISMILFGICGIMCALPYFLQDKSKYDLDLGTGVVKSSNMSMVTMRSASRKVPMCVNINGSDLGNCDVTSGSAQARENIANQHIKMVAYYLIAFGMVFQGIGKSPRSPFITLYIDDAVDKRKTGFYMGIIISTAIFGPVLAYLLGGLFSKLYITLESVDITPSDPRWIGAWWLGFLIFGLFAILFSIPLMCFPRKLKSKSRRKHDALMLKTKGAQGVVKAESSQFLREMKEFGQTIVRLMKNKVYVVLITSGTINLMGVVGGISFLPKYLAAQYSQPLWKSNIIMAFSSISAISLGTFLGGLITRRFQMTPQFTLKLLITFYAITIVTYMSGFFLGCDQPVLYGSNNYGEESPHYKLIQPSCNENCNCDEQKYFPICGDDGRTYFSPCHAGCTESSTSTFSNCTCIPSGQARAGLCDQGCSDRLYTYAALTFFGKLITALKIIPTYIAKIRCVEERDRAACTAFSGFLASALGWMPGPVIIGALIDDTCNLWKYSCGERQSCALYDNRDFRNTLHGYGTAAFCTAFLIKIMLYIYFRVKGQTEWREDKKKTEIEVIKVDAANGKNNIYKPLNKKEEE